MNNILEIRGLTKNFGSKNVLNNINLSIERGRIPGLLGPNGAGKPTLLKLICGLIKESSGEILIDGLHPSEKTKSIVSFLPDKDYFSGGERVIDTVNFFADFYKDFNKGKAISLLQSLNIDINAKFKTLSKGMRERVQLILTMSREASLYLLDEPIGGVDPAARDYILHTIMTNYNPNAAVIISTHLINEVENILDDVIFLKHGSVLLHKSVDGIRENEGKSVDAYFREVYGNMYF